MALGNAFARAQNLRRGEHGMQWDVGPVVAGPAAPMTFAFVHHAGVVAGAKNPEGGWTVIGEYTGKDASSFWMEAHGWPTTRKSYLDLYIKEGQPPPATRANLLEWIKVSLRRRFLWGTRPTSPHRHQAGRRDELGQRSVRDTATALGREITPSSGPGDPRARASPGGPAGSTQPRVASTVARCPSRSRASRPWSGRGRARRTRAGGVSIACWKNTPSSSTTAATAGKTAAHSGRRCGPPARRPARRRAPAPRAPPGGRGRWPHQRRPCAS